MKCKLKQDSCVLAKTFSFTLRLDDITLLARKRARGRASFIFCISSRQQIYVTTARLTQAPPLHPAFLKLLPLMIIWGAAKQSQAVLERLMSFLTGWILLMFNSTLPIICDMINNKHLQTEKHHESTPHSGHIQMMIFNYLCNYLL